MMYEIYFVGWTEMCSRHGDTAKLNIDGAGFLFLLINLFGRRISWMGQQRCDKDNRYAMPLERSIEVCISFDYQTGLFVFSTVFEKQIKAVIYFWGEPKEALSWS